MSHGSNIATNTTSVKYTSRLTVADIGSPYVSMRAWESTQPIDSHLLMSNGIDRTNRNSQ